MAFLIQISEIAQIYSLLISRYFFVYRCHSNIYFPKISILTNVNPKPISGVNLTSIGIGEDYLVKGLK